MVKHPTPNFASGHDLTVRRYQLRVRLCSDNAEPAWDFLSLPLSLPLPYSHTHKILSSLALSLSLSLSLSQNLKISKSENKLKKKKKEYLLGNLLYFLPGFSPTDFFFTCLCSPYKWVFSVFPTQHPCAFFWLQHPKIL